MFIPHLHIQYTISNSLFFFFYPVKFLIFNDSKSTEEMAELLFSHGEGNSDGSFITKISIPSLAAFSRRP